MIFKLEERILKWMAENVVYIAFGAAVLISFFIRYALKDVYTSDADSCLLPWYYAIKENGGIRGLVVPVEGLNYNFPYQFLIAIMTYIPVNPLYGYKILSCIFDYLMAGAVAYLVYDMAVNKKKELALLAFIAVSCSPVVFMDSAAWAQCDSIYVFWIILAIIFLRKEKYLPTFIFYGIAFAFKFQAIFIMPFFLFYYFYKRRFSIIYFFLIPVMMIVLSLPALVQGRTVSEMIHIYTDNTSLHQSLADGYPTFWRVLADGTDYTGADAYGTLKHAAMAFVVIVLGCLVYMWIRNAIELTNRNIILMAFIMTYTTVFFLPAMHERYGYCYEILAIMIAFMVTKTIPLAVALTCISLTTYGGYLFNNTVNEWTMAVINLIVYISYMIILNKELVNKKIAEA